MAKSPSASRTKRETFTADERNAMKARAKELKASSARGSAAEKAAAEQEVVEAIAKLTDTDRDLAECIHRIALSHTPVLAARTWYGMPAYAKDGKVVCFFKPASKFKTRFATLGFEDAANLDDGAMWPTSYALTDLTPAVEKKIAAVIKKAVD